MPKVPYPYEVHDKLVTGSGSLIPICSLSNRSLLPSLTVLFSYNLPRFYLNELTHYHKIFVDITTQNRCTFGMCLYVLLFYDVKISSDPNSKCVLTTKVGLLCCFEV